MTDDLAARLEALRSKADGRSQTARLADHFEDIERTLGAGVSRAAILEQLHHVGLNMSMKAFDVAMYRLRMRRRAQSESRTSPAPVGRARPALPVAKSVRTLASTVTPGQGAGSVSIPDDWRTGVLTAEQRKLLTPEQRRERNEVQQEMAFPTLRPLD